MADTVTTQVINDSSRNYVVRLTNESDGTGETKVKKVTVSTLDGNPTALKVKKIKVRTNGMGVALYWDATTPVLMTSFPASFSDTVEYGVTGMRDPRATGWTGNILVSTLTAANGAKYEIDLYMTKGFR